MTGSPLAHFVAGLRFAGDEVGDNIVVAPPSVHADLAHFQVATIDIQHLPWRRHAADGEIHDDIAGAGIEEYHLAAQRGIGRDHRGGGAGGPAGGVRGAV